MTKRHLQLWALFWTFGFATLSSCTNNSRPDSGTNPAADGISTAEPSIDSAQWLKPTSGIRGIFEDSKGNLWFTSPDWACRYDPSARDSDDGGFTYFTEDWAGVMVSGFQEDSDGRIWMQGADGIHSYDGNQITPITNRNYGARHQWEKGGGDLWFGVDRGIEFSEEEGQWGVYRYHDGECTLHGGCRFSAIARTPERRSLPRSRPHRCQTARDPIVNSSSFCPKKLPRLNLKIIEKDCGKSQRD